MVVIILELISCFINYTTGFSFSHPPKLTPRFKKREKGQLLVSGKMHASLLLSPWGNWFKICLVKRAILGQWSDAQSLEFLSVMRGFRGIFGNILSVAALKSHCCRMCFFREQYLIHLGKTPHNYQSWNLLLFCPVQKCKCRPLWINTC